MELVLDIETNLAHDTIWVCVSQAVGGTEQVTHFSPSTLQPLIDKADKVVGHNIIGFDAPVLQKVWGIKIRDEQLEDTLVLSRLFDPSVTGGHSLEAWGKRLGGSKDDFDVADFDNGYTEKMLTYCKKDVLLTEQLLRKLRALLKKSKFSEYSMELETKVAIIVKQQEVNGFEMDTTAATCLYNELTLRQERIHDQLQEVFPPITHKRVSEKTGKDLADRIERFNVGSRQQIAARLMDAGVVLTERNEPTKLQLEEEKKTGVAALGSYIINDDVLQGMDFPEAQAIWEYLLLQKRTSMLKSWIKHVDGTRMHGKVITNGTVTGRMTHHSVNMAQVPAVNYSKDKEVLTGLEGGYGYEFRSMWTVKTGNVLVGIDASGLELRMLAHYLQDDEYTDEVVNGDIHTKNMNAAGLTTRDQAKTFIYAWLYGSGAGLLGKIVGGNKNDGSRLVKQFMEAVPAVAVLRDKIQRIAASGSVPALDGRRVRIRSPHSALNFLLQSAGSIVMKQALIFLVEALDKHSIPYQIVASVHDEWQIETPAAYGDIVGKAGRRAIIRAGEYFEMRCTLDGDYQVGNNWAETH
tara:strand:- start:5375 stop:7108 length:1734 start_codon:yes stop_codon:yes gene_type:complete